MTKNNLLPAAKAPRLLLIGPGRCGTTSLFGFLSTHNQLSPSRIKETNFFTPLLLGKRLETLDTYLEFFRNKEPSNIRFEATPSYFLGGKTIADAVNKICPDSYVLIVLRNPADKFISSYNHYRTKLDVNSVLSLEEYFYLCKGFEPSDLSDVKDIYRLSLYEGHYADRLADWVSVLGWERILLFFYEDLKRSPQVIVHGISDALGIDPRGFSDSGIVKTNVSSGFKNALLHRMAMRTNLVFEPFFNAHPNIKQTVKGWYGKINGAPLQVGSMWKQGLHLIEHEYRTSNEKLYYYLTQLGKKRLPSWVKDL